MRSICSLLVLGTFALGMCAMPARADDDHDHVPELDFTQAPSGTLVWGALAKVGIRRIDGKIVRTFTAPVLELDGKRVTLYGYATPVNDLADPRRLFLLSSVRIACRGCAAPVEPEGVVEVSLKRPAYLRTMLRTTDALPVRGKLVLVKDDSKGLLYQMVDAQIITRDGRARIR
jgi:hypothetical protein